MTEQEERMKEVNKLALAAACYALPRRKRESLPGTKRQGSLLRYLWPFSFLSFKSNENTFGIDVDGRQKDLEKSSEFLRDAIGLLSQQHMQEVETNYLPVNESVPDTGWVSCDELIEDVSPTQNQTPHISGVIHGKVWGITQRIFYIPGVVDIWYMRIEPHSWCSKHYHVGKHNCFYLINNELTIEVWKDYGLIDETLLDHAGQSTTCKPGEKHRFRNSSDYDTEAIEIYWGDNIREDDIIREDHGGKDEGANHNELKFSQTDIMEAVQTAKEISEKVRRDMMVGRLDNELNDEVVYGDSVWKPTFPENSKPEEAETTWTKIKKFLNWK